MSFEGDAWLDYVPLRAPDTVVVHERLPPGAAAVLINRRHSFTDLYLPVNAQQKELVDAIDGHRSIGEIAPGLALRKLARVLFEGLWWYDQVVFDLSGSSASGTQGKQEQRVQEPSDHERHEPAAPFGGQFHHRAVHDHGT